MKGKAMRCHLLPIEPFEARYSKQWWDWWPDGLLAHNIEVNVRGNERSYRRIMASAQGAGAISVSENGGLLDPVTGVGRDTSSYVWGYRPVDTALTCSSGIDRSVHSWACPA